MRRSNFLVTIVSALLTGCTYSTNPSFPLTSADAKVAWSAMVDDPKPFTRPILILGGIYDPGLAAAKVERSLRQITGEGDHDQIIHVGFLDTLSFDSAAAKAIEALNKHVPSNDPSQTIEVDVIGFSMGGLVARYAASDIYAAKSGRRLRIARLFTVSSPHQGAKLAWVPVPDSRVSDMRSDSAFLAQLNADQRDYELIASPARRNAVLDQQTGVQSRVSLLRYADSCRHRSPPAKRNAFHAAPSGIVAEEVTRVRRSCSAH